MTDQRVTAFNAPNINPLALPLTQNHSLDDAKAETGPAKPTLKAV